MYLYRTCMCMCVFRCMCMYMDRYMYLNTSIGIALGTVTCACMCTYIHRYTVDSRAQGTCNGCFGFLCTQQTIRLYDAQAKPAEDAATTSNLDTNSSPNADSCQSAPPTHQETLRYVLYYSRSTYCRKLKAYSRYVLLERCGMSRRRLVLVTSFWLLSSVTRRCWGSRSIMIGGGRNNTS